MQSLREPVVIRCWEAAMAAAGGRVVFGRWGIRGKLGVITEGTGGVRTPLARGLVW